MMDLDGMIDVLGFCAILIGIAGALSSFSTLVLTPVRRMGSTAYTYIGLLASGSALLIGALLAK